MDDPKQTPRHATRKTLQMNWTLPAERKANPSNRNSLLGTVSSPHRNLFVMAQA
jgi:hypothetical protein